MKYFFKYVFFTIVIFFISGCNGLIETEVKLSQLQSKENLNINGDLYIEVAGCSYFSDSRRESDSVRESKMTIPSIFKDAQYVECFQKEFQSYTHFTIPMIISKENSMVLNDYIHIISNGKNLLDVGVPTSIKRNMDRAKENSFGMTDINLNVQIKFINDTNKDLPFKVVSAYLDNKPYIYGELSSNKQSEFWIRLSDVSVDNALNNQFSSVLLKK